MLRKKTTHSPGWLSQEKPLKKKRGNAASEKPKTFEE